MIRFRPLAAGLVLAAATTYFVPLDPTDPAPPSATGGRPAPLLSGRPDADRLADVIAVHASPWTRLAGVPANRDIAVM